jgi:plasmid stabilization system protein ParE
MPPYIVVYRITGADTVTILRVWHAAQNRPGSS